MSVATDSWGRTYAPFTTSQADLFAYIRSLAQPCPFSPWQRVLPLDLNDSRQREFFEARFPLTQGPRRLSPGRREIFDATAAWQARNGVATLPQTVHFASAVRTENPRFPGWRPETAGGRGAGEVVASTWQPAAFIAAANYIAGTSLGSAGAAAVLTVPGVVQVNELTLEIVDDSDGHTIASDSSGEIKSPYITLSVQGQLMNPGDSFTAYATGYYVPSGASFAVPVVTFTQTEPEASGEEEEGAQPQLTLSVTNPVNIVTPQGSPIKVALNRDNVIPDCDYYYSDGTTTVPSEISLAVTGTATAPAGNSFDAISGTNVNGSLIIVSRSGGASVTFPSSSIPPAVTSATSVLTWTLDPATAQQSPPWNSGDTVDLYFTLNFGMNNSGPQPNTSLFVTSDPSTPPGLQNTALTPPLIFLWGCLAEDEPVRMADGSLRPIREVEIGEMVRAAGGGALRVVNLTRGREPKPMLRLVLEDGRAVRMSDGHPVRAEGAWVLARDLVPGTRVETEEGPRALLRVEPFRYEGEVRNLVLAPADAPADDLDPEDAAFFAAGVLVGDNRLQGHAGARGRQAAAAR